MLNKIFKKLYSLIPLTSVAITNSSEISFFDDDVFLVSYPKSGNTWLRFLIGNYLTGNKCDFTNSHLIVPDIHFNPEQCNQIQRPRFIKSHMPFVPNYRKVVYIVRDGRDVAVSYYFHLMKIRKISKDTDFNIFIEHFNKGSFDTFSSWSDHVKSWIENKPQDFLLIRYEDMKLEPIIKLIEVLEFSGIDVDYDVAAKAVEASQFEKMKDLEKKQYKLFKGLANYDDSIPFVRKGEVGNWKSFFTDELAESFTKIHGSALEYLDYL